MDARTQKYQTARCGPELQRPAKHAGPQHSGLRRDWPVKSPPGTQRPAPPSTTKQKNTSSETVIKGAAADPVDAVPHRAKKEYPPQPPSSAAALLPNPWPGKQKEQGTGCGRHPFGDPLASHACASSRDAPSRSPGTTARQRPHTKSRHASEKRGQSGPGPGSAPFFVRSRIWWAAASGWSALICSAQGDLPVSSSITEHPKDQMSAEWL
mmetsp:Transcript_62329/g.177126  ORF Transcript_62329/g.177126 Transcript_62329/m.177126 type:complete len:210 (-) Transcript_62329:1280-1909(-)